MNEARQIADQPKSEETPAREPLFRRYQIKIKASVHAGAFPTGFPPIGR